MNEIAVIERGDSPLLKNAADLAVFEEQVERLVADEQAGLLDEARRQAEAYSLYEKRKNNAKLEHHYAKCRLLAEAGLGVLCYDSPKLIDGVGPGIRQQWRTLAAAFERHKLLDVCDELLRCNSPLTMTNMTIAIRNRGYTYAPGKILGIPGSVIWAKARAIAREKGIALSDIPPDRAYAVRRSDAASEQSRRMWKIHEAHRRLKRIKNQKQIAAAAKEKGPQLDKAYGLLRRTLQALHEAQTELNRDERTELDWAFSRLYNAEECIGRVLGVLPKED